jgi:hypothetical protein
MLKPVRCLDALRLLSIQLSIDYDIVRHLEGPSTADHAVRQRITDFLPDFLLPCGRLISVRWGEFRGEFLPANPDIDALENRHRRSNPL